MKVYFSFLALSLLLLTGCQTEDLLLRREIATGVPVATPVYVTNVNHVVETYWNTNVIWTTNVLFEVRTNVTAVIDTISTVNSLVPGNPVGPAVEGGLALLTLGLGFYARLKTRQANTSLSNKQKLEETLRAVIVGIEAAGDAATKFEVEKASKVAGKEQDLAALVNEITRNMSTSKNKPS